MIRNLLIAALAVAATACAQTPTYDEPETADSVGNSTQLDECSGAPQLVMVNYGDSEIRIVPPVKDLARKDILRFRLVPDKKNSDEVNYNKTIVTIKGKTTDDKWIDVSGSYDSTGGFMDVCVKPGLEKKTYRYFVEVPDVGKIDPRADVTR